MERLIISLAAAGQVPLIYWMGNGVFERSGQLAWCYIFMLVFFLVVWVFLEWDE
jgi:hypothetical protein